MQSLAMDGAEVREVAGIRCMAKLFCELHSVTAN
jgi:hypothetical protein